jgi:hypothetical protein
VHITPKACGRIAGSKFAFWRVTVLTYETKHPESK